MSADAALFILGGRTDSQICTALQGRPAVRARLQRILRWGPPPSQQPQHSTQQQGTAPSQEVPWPDGSKPAMSDPISTHAHSGGVPSQQAQQAPQHWAQHSNTSSRNWFDVTEQEQSQQASQAAQHQSYYDWDTGTTRTEPPAQQEHWHSWDQSPDTASNKGNGKQPSTQQQAQHQQHSQPQSWGGGWQHSPSKGKSWDDFSSNADWTNYPAQQAPAQQQQQTAPTPATKPADTCSELQWSGDRPYHQNPRTGEWLCALACTNTYCRFGRPACNFKPKGRIVDIAQVPSSDIQAIDPGASLHSAHQSLSSCIGLQLGPSFIDHPRVLCNIWSFLDSVARTSFQVSDFYLHADLRWFVRGLPAIADVRGRANSSDSSTSTRSGHVTTPTD